MQADHAPFSIDYQCNETVLADRLPGSFNFSAGLAHALCLYGAICAGEVDNCAVRTRWVHRQFDQSSRSAVGFQLHRKSPHLELSTIKFLKFNAEHCFIETLCAIHLININLEPAHWIIHVALR